MDVGVRRPGSTGVPTAAVDRVSGPAWENASSRTPARLRPSPRPASLRLHRIERVNSGRLSNAARLCLSLCPNDASELH